MKKPVGWGSRETIFVPRLLQFKGNNYVLPMFRISWNILWELPYHLQELYLVLLISSFPWATQFAQPKKAHFPGTKPSMPPAQINAPTRYWNSVGEIIENAIQRNDLTSDPPCRSFPMPDPANLSCWAHFVSSAAEKALRWRLATCLERVKQSFPEQY